MILTRETEPDKSENAPAPLCRCDCCGHGVPRDIFGSLSILFNSSNHSSLHKKTGQKKELDIFEKERYHVDRLVRVNVQIIIVYLFAQKTFIAGLTSGSVKG